MERGRAAAAWASFSASSSAMSVRTPCSTVSARATLRTTVAAAASRCGTAPMPACTTSEGAICASRCSTGSCSSAADQRVCGAARQRRDTWRSSHPAAARAANASSASAARDRPVTAQ